MGDTITVTRVKSGNLHFSPLAYLSLSIAFVSCLMIRTAGRGILSAEPPGWLTWFDQGQYWRSALAFAHGNLASNQHWYPPLYSLLMAPFARLGPAAATLLVDLPLYLACYWGFSSVARQFGIVRGASLLIYLYATLLIPGVASTWLDPWTTTLSASLILGSLALALKLVSSTQDERHSFADYALGALLGLIVCARPAEVVISATIGAFVAWHFLVRLRDWYRIAAMIAGGAIVVVPYALLYLAIWGAAPSEYARLASAIGFNFTWLGWKAYLLLIEPQPWYPDSISMLKAMPWLILGLTGALVLLIKAKEQRTKVLLVLLAILAYVALMLAYVDLLPSGLWRYNNIHYFKWAILLFALFAWKFLTGFNSARLLSLGIFSLILLAACVRFDPIPAAPDAPARMIAFRSNKATFTPIYTGEITINDRVGIQRNFFDVHAVLGSDDLIRVNALRRNFQGQETVAAPAPDATAQRAALATRSDGTTGLEDYGPLAGRFTSKPKWGVPCWIPSYHCPAGLPGMEHAAPATDRSKQ